MQRLPKYLTYSKIKRRILKRGFSGEGGVAVSNCFFKIYAKHKNLPRGLNAECLMLRWILPKVVIVFKVKNPLYFYE